MQRRDFLRMFPCIPGMLAGCAETPAPKLPPGEWMGADPNIGHRLLKGDFPPVSETRSVPVLIIGAGVSGLAAAWRFKKQGFSDFLLVDLEKEAGGNARSGRNAFTAYPWGAHYLPLPPPEAVSVRELLADLGVLQGDHLAEVPVYDERYLNATPHDRLYRDGNWEEGLLPHLGVSANEIAEQQKFYGRMEAMKMWRGRDGRRAFASPLGLSSQDPEILALDEITFRTWLDQEGFSSPSLRWITDYACRDDYGTSAAQTSAWAGLHYFVSRRGQAAHASPDTVLTMPEGNHWLVRGMQQQVESCLKTGCLAFGLEQEAQGVKVDLWSAAEGRSIRYQARQVIFAAPMFVLQRIAPSLPPILQKAAGTFSYAPWLVANLTLSSLPHERGGASIAWENVFYDSDSLGYVVATHQHFKLAQGGPTVLTWYYAPTELEPSQARRMLLEKPREYWAEMILADIGKAHPDIRQLTTRLDVAVYGHAMARPVPGFLWGTGRRAFEKPWGKVHFAHTDTAGLSLFEEAHVRGASVAERVLKLLS